MPRTLRVVNPGMPHHVTHRGNNKQDIFYTFNDYMMYLAYLKSDLDSDKSRLFAYCLMNNHIHLILIPQTEASLARVIGSTHGHYAQYFNKVNRRTGHLWEGRFNSCQLDENHCIHAARYVERNPVRARIVDNPWDYPWSSASEHVNGNSDLGILDRAIWDKFITSVGLDWRKFIGDIDDAAITEKIREFTKASKSFNSPRGQAPDFYPPTW